MRIIVKPGEEKPGDIAVLGDAEHISEDYEGLASWHIRWLPCSSIHIAAPLMRALRFQIMREVMVLDDVLEGNLVPPGEEQIGDRVQINGASFLVSMIYTGSRFGLSEPWPHDMPVTGAQLQAMGAMVFREKEEPCVYEVTVADVTGATDTAYSYEVKGAARIPTDRQYWLSDREPLTFKEPGCLE